MEIPAGSPMHFVQENIHKIPTELQAYYHELMRLYEQEYQFVHISKVPMMNQCLEEIFKSIKDLEQRLRAALIFHEEAPGDHNHDGGNPSSIYLDEALKRKIIDMEMLVNWIEPRIETMFEWNDENFYEKKVQVVKALKEEIQKDKEEIQRDKEEIQRDKEEITELDKKRLERFKQKEQDILD
ncbi:MAG: hypothetical protein WBJ84_03660 [Bacteroidales bacterium]